MGVFIAQLLASNKNAFGTRHFSLHNNIIHGSGFDLGRWDPDCII